MTEPMLKLNDVWLDGRGEKFIITNSLWSVIDGSYTFIGRAEDGTKRTFDQHGVFHPGSAYAAYSLCRLVRRDGEAVGDPIASIDEAVRVERQRCASVAHEFTGDHFSETERNVARLIWQRIMSGQ